MRYNLHKAMEIIAQVWNHPGTEHKRIRVMSRFLAWQLVEKRFAKGGIVKNWIDGRKLLVCPGRTVSTGNYYFGLMEYEEMSFLLHYARASDVFVDCGANVGIYCLLLGPICQKGIAIEPSMDTFRILERNLQLNDLTNVLRCNLGLSDQAGVRYFTKGLDAENHVVEETSDNCVQINVDTLDAICKEDRGRISIIKIDVEGHEKELLRGAAETLRDSSVNVLLMEIFGNDELVSIMRGYGFGIYKYDPRTKTLIESKDYSTSQNGIFIRDIELARRRVSEAVYGFS